MADSIELDPGTGGVKVLGENLTVATSTLYAQWSKILLGADGVNDNPVHSSNPLPVSTGPITANIGTISTIATQATLAQVSTFTQSTNTILAQTLSSQTLRITLAASDVALGGGTQYVEGSTSTAPTGTVMLWKAGVSTLRATSTSDPLPVSTLPLTANIGTISTIATQATLAEISTSNASSVSLLSSNKLRLENISTFTNSTNTLLVQISSNTASTNALLSTQTLSLTSTVSLASSQLLRLNSISTFANSTNTMLAGALASTGALWVQAVPGAAQSTISATVAINTAIVDGSGTQITSFGGGTQYVEGNTTTLPTGTAMLWKSAVSTMSPVATSLPLPVHMISTSVSIGGGTQYVDGNTSTNPTGTVMLWKSAVSTLVPVTTSLGLPVNVIAGSLNANTQYVEGNTTTLATGITMLWKSAVSTLTAVTSSAPLPVSSAPLTANIGTVSSLATQATLAEISTFSASTVSLLSSNKLRLETISTTVNSTNTLLVQISSNTASSNALVSTQGVTLGNISTFTNSTNTLLVTISSLTASSNALVSTQGAVLLAISSELKPTPTGIYVQPIPVSSNGLTPYMTLDCNNSTQQVVSTAATLYGIYFGNTSTKVSYLKIWDGVSSATFVSSTAATMCVPVPGNSTDVIAGNFNAGNSHGIKMSTGICIAGVFGPNNGNSTQIGISTLIVNLFYKS